MEFTFSSYLTVNEGIITFPEYVFVPEPRYGPIVETVIIGGSSTGTGATIIGNADTPE